MKTIAVIIKHPYRDYDFRVDIMQVPEDTTWDEVRDQVAREMLGPFEILAITEKINLNRAFKPVDKTIEL